MIFTLVLLGNFWIWNIARFNLPLFLLLTITTVSLYLYYSQKISAVFLVFLLAFLCYCQWQTTTVHSLIIKDNDEKRIETIRKRLYQPSLDISRKVFNRLPVANLLEGDISIGVTRLERNFFETIDLNVYFFGGHPRERVWANDFAKFPHILFVPFLVGLYNIFQKNDRLLLMYLGLSLVIFSLLGHLNKIGPFFLFPFFVLAIDQGIKTLWKL